MIILIVIYLHILKLVLPVSCSAQPGPDQCQGYQQKDIISSMSECSIRPTLIDLRKQFANNSDVIQVVPDHVTVNKCGGSCFVPPHSCNPGKETKMVVQVMLVLSKWPHGEHETICTEVEVDVHHECECGCKVHPDQCLPDVQYYHHPSCRYAIITHRSTSILDDAGVSVQT